MASVQENRAQFNPHLFVSHTGGSLSSDSGLVLIKELMEALNFTQQAKEKVTFQDSRAYWQHDNHAILEQLIFQLFAGYSADSSANVLRQDPVFQSLLGERTLASQSSISHFLDRISETNVQQLQDLNQGLIDQARTIRNTTELLIDLDSTHSDTFGYQEQTDYNAHYQTNGYHPLVAFDGLTGDFLKAELRSGNQYTSNGVKAFLQPLFRHYKETVPVSSLLVRWDSGFAIPDLYRLCETYRHHYVVRLKNNRKLGELAEQFVTVGEDTQWEETETHYQSVFYQAQSWSKPRRVCIRSTRPGGELLFQHEFIVTNLSGNVSPQQIFDLYAKRGTMENYIKEAKHGFFFDKTDSPRFVENQARIMFSVLAYNIVNILRTLCFTGKWRGLQIQTIRLRLFKVAGKLVRTARRLYLKLSSYHVFQRDFYAIHDRIQKLRGST